VDLSVVVATTDAGASIERCLDHLDRTCAGLSAETLVVDASTDGTADRVERRGGAARLFRLPSGTLAPELWAEGLRRSSGRVVALTTGHCLVPAGWATSLLSAIDEGASAAGGPLALGPRTRTLDWAVYYLRYSGFIPERFGSGRTAGELAGDNAAYARAALDRYPEVLAGGFWELDVHREIRAEGGWLSRVPSAVVEFTRSFPLPTILGHRFAHGAHFGASRVRGGTRRLWQVLVASPLVPAVLAARAGSRVLGVPAHRWRFVLSLPWFLLLASSWAAGEAWGALREARA
jgi:hypothetical protein